MGHHGVVHQGDAQTLAILQAQWFGVREFDAVERPRKLLHVTGQVKLDGAIWLAAVRILESAFQVGVSEHSTTIVPQAYARIVQLWRWTHGLHVNQGIVGFRGWVSLHSSTHTSHASHP